MQEIDIDERRAAPSLARTALGRFMAAIRRRIGSVDRSSEITSSQIVGVFEDERGELAHLLEARGGIHVHCRQCGLYAKLIE